MSKRRRCLKITVEDLQRILLPFLNEEAKDKIPIYIEYLPNRSIIKIYYDGIGNIMAEGDEVPEDLELTIPEGIVRI